MQELTCALCGEKIDEMDDDYEDLADGGIVCLDCYLSKCKACRGCFGLFPKKDMIDVTIDVQDIDEYVCKSCFDESISVCDGCGKSVSFYLMHHIEGRWLCQDCYKPPEIERTMPQYSLQDLLREYRENREKQQNS